MICNNRFETYPFEYHSLGFIIREAGLEILMLQIEFEACSKLENFLTDDKVLYE